MCNKSDGFPFTFPRKKKEEPKNKIEPNKKKATKADNKPAKSPSPHGNSLGSSAEETRGSKALQKGVTTTSGKSSTQMKFGLTVSPNNPAGAASSASAFIKDATKTSSAVDDLIGTSPGLSVSQLTGNARNKPAMTVSVQSQQ